ncbi:MAG: hypothetical protein WCT16_03590 [Candidatus Buchananbacteria bacterium]
MPEKKVSQDKGFIGVKVAKLPGLVKEIGLNGRRTVADALEGADLDAEEGYELRVNNEVVGTDHVLSDGDIVLLVEEITGN